MSQEDREALGGFREEKKAASAAKELEGFRMAAAGGGATPPATGPSATGGGQGITPPVRMNPGPMMLKALGPLALLAGISLSLVGMLKLSKVMGAATGAIQSMLGAIIDSFLAPLIIELLPDLLTLMAKLIPYARLAGEKAAETVRSLKDLLGQDSTSRERREGGADLIDTLGQMFKAVDKITPERMDRDPVIGSVSAAAAGIGKGLDKIAEWVRPGSKEDFGGRQTDFNTITQLQKMNDEKLGRFLELSASRGRNYVFNITGTSNEEILSAMRLELDALTGNIQRGVNP